jgi:flagellar biosynthesis anti-sigma factor FlgM
MKAAASATDGAVVQMSAYTRNSAKPKTGPVPGPPAKTFSREHAAVVRVSTASRMAELVRSVVLSAPEIRTETVEPLRIALNAGRYDFNPQRVAEKMLAW